MQHAFRLGVVIAFVLAWVGRATAMQSGPFISELVEYGDVRAVVPGRTAEVFIRVVNASPDQAVAAGDLVEAARTEVARVVNRHLRTVRDDPTLQAMRDSESMVVQRAGVVERQLLEDLMAILTPEQQPLFPKFERAHRRSLLRRMPPQPMSVDLWEFCAANRFDPSTSEAVSALLDRFDRESDAALIRQRRALLAYYADVRRGSDGTEESQARSRKALNELIAANANLNQVCASIVEPILSALPSGLSEKLIYQIIEGATREFDKNLSDPDRYPVIREVLALKLTPDQRQAVQSLVRSAKAESLALARTTVIEQARFVLLDDKTRTDGRTSPLNLYLGDASKLRVRVSESALAVLTEQQRLEYDASEVIDPSTSSTVKDE